MTYRPTEFEVNNSGGIGCDIYIDPESLLESTMFFKIDQDSEGITVSLECLENLIACANELLQAWRETRGDAPSNVGGNRRRSAQRGGNPTSAACWASG